MDYEAVMPPAKRLKKAASREQALMPYTTAAGPRNNYANFNEQKMKMRMLLKLSDHRIMKVTRDAIVLVDEARNKFAVLNFQKFSKILMHLAEIDEAVMKLRNYESVNVRYEIGGNWAVTITSGVSCVNIRRWFYKGQDPTPYPTRIGMSLRLPEWNMFKKHIPTIQTHRVDIAAVVPCFLSEDHYNQEGALNCCECNPNIEPDYTTSSDSGFVEY
jgi:hypothetical protein